MAELFGDAVIMFLIGCVIWYLFSRFMKKYPHGYANRNKDYTGDKTQSEGLPVKICRKCCEENELDAKYCNRCGTKLSKDYIGSIRYDAAKRGLDLSNLANKGKGLVH